MPLPPPAAELGRSLRRAVVVRDVVDDAVAVHAARLLAAGYFECGRIEADGVGVVAGQDDSAALTWRVRWSSWAASYATCRRPRAGTRPATLRIGAVP